MMTRSVTGRCGCSRRPPGIVPNTVRAAKLQSGWIPASVNPTCLSPRKKRTVTFPLHPNWLGIVAGASTRPVVVSTYGRDRARNGLVLAVTRGTGRGEG